LTARRKQYARHGTSRRYEVDSFRYVILGGGMVAGYAAQEMVERGLRRDELAIVSSDGALPYERPPLSKGFLRGDEDEPSVYINDSAFYADHGIDVRLSTVVERVDTASKQLELKGSGELRFERLLVATGAHVRTLDVPGGDLEGICYLRSLDDSKRIRSEAQGRETAVVLGSGFIGMEVAAVLSQMGLQVTMAFPEERVWERFFTPEMSRFFERYYEERGVTIARGETAARFAWDQRVAAVQMESGASYPAELVVAGVGVMPAIEVLEGSGIDLDNGVLVNEYLETNVADVLAAGDVANYQDVLFGKRRRVEHWDNAVEQGKHAARALLGEREPFIHVPYFFSDVFDLSYELWGDTEDADEVVTRGDLETPSFSVWWLRGGRVRAAFAMDRPDEERDLAQELIRDSKSLPASFRSSS
jgi:NADPH-dependent 2,4-dienoyl-CoA reductase/sulfur reductase-like enzyme